MWKDSAILSSMFAELTKIWYILKKGMPRKRPKTWFGVLLGLDHSIYGNEMRGILVFLSKQEKKPCGCAHWVTSHKLTHF